MVEYYGLMLVVFVFFYPCVVHTSVHLLYVYQFVFSFPDDNLSKCQWIFTKLSMCIGIVEVWFGIANGKILSVLTALSGGEYYFTHLLHI